MMFSLYTSFNEKINHQSLFEWHKRLTNGRRDLINIGRYRTHQDPMQIVSGSFNRPEVHFEAPASTVITKEINGFIHWFNESHFNSSTQNSIVKAGITHFYFVTIHPFEYGNGRVARALTEKSLGLSLGKSSFTSLSKIIQEDKQLHCEMLESHNTLDITDWLVYFGGLLVKIQENTIEILDFTIKKTRFLINIQLRSMNDN